MKRFNKVTPEGTKDILFEECLARREVSRRLAQVFQMRGYNEVITPGIEYYDVFDAADAAIPQYEMYKSTDNKGRLIVFRPDLTLPIARLTATRLQSMEKPVRLYYNQPVYRNRKDLSGRSDESMQAGIELLGATGLRADIEVIAAAVDALSACTERFRFEIGNARFFRLLADELPVSDDRREDIRMTIESKNYAALGDMLDGLEPSLYTEAIRKLPRLFGGAEVFAEAERFCVGHPALSETLNYTRTLYGALAALGLGDRLMVDFGLVQRNDYYTGVVFSAYAEHYGDAILMGGRYDNLLQQFDAPMPAIGFAADVDALAACLAESAAVPVPDVLVHAHPGAEARAQLRIRALTAEGRRCESSVFETAQAAREYAARRGIPEVVEIGLEENA